MSRRRRQAAQHQRGRRPPPPSHRPVKARADRVPAAAAWEAVRATLFREPTEEDRKASALARVWGAYREAHDAAILGAHGAPQLYHRTFHLAQDLYDSDPHGPVSESCLEAIVLLLWELWQLDRDQFPIALSIQFATELARRQPLAANSWYVLGHLHQNAGDWPRALGCARLAARLDPLRSPAWVHIGICELALGDVEGGRRALEHSVALKPEPEGSEVDETGFQRWFILGHYGAGWRGWARLNDRMLNGSARVGPRVRPLVGRPHWAGERVGGRVLLYMEHGHGDTLQMLRWVPEVRDRVGGLTLRVRPEMVPLLAKQWEGVEVTSHLEAPGDFDQCVLSYSLPAIFGVEHPDHVARPPYLRPPGTFRRLPGAFRVGLRWAGDRAHTYDLLRSTSLADWAPLLDVPGVTFYSLQVGRGSEQLGPFADRIQDLAPELTDWAQTAAAMADLDLVISVDTSCSHLAGALGRPVWICLPAAPEWRWMLERTDTPWYASARLFRQPRAGDWSSVFAEVARALQGRVASTTVAAA